jgi:hypothetical protein
MVLMKSAAAPVLTVRNRLPVIEVSLRHQMIMGCYFSSHLRACSCRLRRRQQRLACFGAIEAALRSTNLLRSLPCARRTGPPVRFDRRVLDDHKALNGWSNAR